MGRKSKMILALVLSILLLPFGLLSSISVEAASTPTVRYRTHVQRDGWQTWRSNGQMSGTSGRALRLEGIEINLQGANGGIRYRTHVQRDGWQGWRNCGQMSGTSGRALRLEGIEIQLTGAIANTHHVEYRVHVQTVGWQGWVRDGAMARTSGRALRLEAIEIRLVPRGIPASPVCRPATGLGTQCRTHAQTQGWRGGLHCRTPAQRNGWQDWCNSRNIR